MSSTAPVPPPVKKVFSTKNKSPTSNTATEADNTQPSNSKASSASDEKPSPSIENKTSTKVFPTTHPKVSKTTKPETCSTAVTANAEFANSSANAASTQPASSSMNVKREKTRVPVAKPEPRENTLEVELQQLQIRFPDLKTETSANGTCVEFRMPIVDPDFPYDLPFAHLRCLLPPGYPNNSHVQFEVLNEEIPPKFRKVVKERMNATARTFSPGELIIRPMLRYLEKNFEHFLTENAAVNRFKFFPPTCPPKPQSSETTKEEAGAEDEEMKNMQNILKEFGISRPLENNNCPSLGGDEEDFISLEPTEDGIEKFMSASQFMPPTAIRLENDGNSSVRGDTFSLILSGHRLQNIAHLYVTQISFTLKCGRCQAQIAVKGLRPFVDRFEPCIKCSTRIPILFEPQLLLSQNNCFGSLRMGNKAGFIDLLPCVAQISCMECSAEHNTPAVQLSIHSGEVLSSKLPKCFHAFSLSLGQCTATAKAALSPAFKRKRPAVPTGISIGSPLPLNGACQHYGKSFRWYRFPCCGRAFPCDVCHDTGTKEAPHEMERAQRFLCGYCAREQSIHSKRCECGVDWSKGAAPSQTAHWEGGKGMRDRTSMSRKDSHKYKGLSKSS